MKIGDRVKINKTVFRKLIGEICVVIDIGVYGITIKASDTNYVLYKTYDDYHVIPSIADIWGEP